MKIGREAGMSWTVKMRRQGDKTSEPPGGRAAERLRMFERARGFVDQPVEPRVKKLGVKRKKVTSPEKQLTSRNSTPTI
jgi:hypothetical protein